MSHQKKPQVSMGGAFRVATASIVFAATCTVILLVIGLSVVVIVRHGKPEDRDLLVAFLVSLSPWAIVVLQLIHSTTRGISSVFPKPTPQPMRHVIEPYGLPQGHNYHMVPVTGPVEPTLDDVPIYDLIEFIEQVPIRGVTYGAWCRPQYKFKSGRKCTYETWQRLCGILIKGGILIDRGERRKRYLRTRDPQVIKSKLRVYQILETR